MMALRQFPRVKDWKIHPTIMDICDSERQLLSCLFCHVRRGANSAMHQLASWAVTEFLLRSNSSTIEHFPNLSWLYAGMNAP